MLRARVKSETLELGGTLFFTRSALPAAPSPAAQQAHYMASREQPHLAASESNLATAYTIARLEHATR